jgi:hypothetical protein
MIVLHFLYIRSIVQLNTLFSQYLPLTVLDLQLKNCMMSLLCFKQQMVCALHNKSKIKQKRQLQVVKSNLLSFKCFNRS